jgi:hypothetical protein
MCKGSLRTKNCCTWIMNESFHVCMYCLVEMQLGRNLKWSVRLAARKRRIRMCGRSPPFFVGRTETERFATHLCCTYTCQYIGFSRWGWHACFYIVHQFAGRHGAAIQVCTYVHTKPPLTQCVIGRCYLCLDVVVRAMQQIFNLVPFLYWHN